MSKVREEVGNVLLGLGVVLIELSQKVITWGAKILYPGRELSVKIEGTLIIEKEGEDDKL